jgi:hypothetical protein
VYLLVPGQHLDEFPDAPRARFGLLHRLNSKQDRVPVGAIESSEERLCPRIAVERRLQIVRHLGAAH